MREIPKDWSVGKATWETKLTPKLSIISIKIGDEGEWMGTKAAQRHFQKVQVDKRNKE